MNGNNQQSSAWNDTFDPGYLTDAWYDYDGDNGGNVTTIDHALYSLNLVPNVMATVVMDISSGLI